MNTTKNGEWFQMIQSYALPVSGIIYVGENIPVLDIINYQQVLKLRKQQILYVETNKSAVETFKSSDPELQIVHRASSSSFMGEIKVTNIDAHILSSATLDICLKLNGYSDFSYNMLCIDSHTDESALLQGFIHGLLSVDFVHIKVNHSNTLDEYLNPQGFERVDTCVSSCKSYRHMFYIRRNVASNLHLSPLSMKSTSLFSEVEIIKQLPVSKNEEKSLHRESPTSFHTFVAVHDQGLLLNHAARFGYLWPNLTYIFVGKRPCGAVEKRRDTVVARHLPNNIENQPDLLSFTAWWLVATILAEKVGLKSDNNHVVLLEYDMVPVVDLDEIQHHLETKIAEGADTVSFIQTTAMLNDMGVVFIPLMVHFGITTRPTDVGREPWYATSNHSVAIGLLRRFVKWYINRVPLIRKLDQPRVPWYHERVFYFYMRTHGYRMEYVNGLEHKFCQDYIYRGPAHTNNSIFKLLETNNSLLPLPPSGNRNAALPSYFDWKWYQIEVSTRPIHEGGTAGTILHTEFDCIQHWRTIGARSGLSCHSTLHTSVWRSLDIGSTHRVQCTFLYPEDNGESVSDALACGFTHVHVIESNIRQYLYVACRFRGDSRVTIVCTDHSPESDNFNSSETKEIKTTSDPVNSYLQKHLETIFTPTTFCIPLIHKELISVITLISTHKLSDDHSLVLHGYSALKSERRHEIQSAIRKAFPRHAFRFTPGPDGDVDTWNIYLPLQTCATYPLIIPTLFISSLPKVIEASYGNVENVFDVTAIVSKQWRSSMDTSEAKIYYSSSTSVKKVLPPSLLPTPAELGQDPSPHNSKQLYIKYIDSSGHRREVFIEEKYLMWQTNFIAL